MTFSVLVLGSGAAIPTHGRNCSSQVVTIGSSHMLLDCGESTQNYLRKYHQRLQSFSTIFISHLHGDHFFGLPGLLSTMHLCGRTEPVTVFAPRGLKSVIDLLFSVSGTELRFGLNIIELDSDEPQTIYHGKNFKVTAIPLNHSVPTYGYIFEEENLLPNIRKGMIVKYQLTTDDCQRLKRGEDINLPDGTVLPNDELTYPPRKPRSYAYCCDTAYFDMLPQWVKGVNLLCIESTFDNAFIDMAEKCLHCTAAQAASVAAQAEVDSLLLTHFSARYKELDSLLEEARSVFPNVQPAVDGGIYQID